MASKNYCKPPRTRLAVLAACLCLPPLWAQSNQHLIAGISRELIAQRGASAEVKIEVSVQPGFHINSNKPLDSYLIPLKLTWAPGALEPVEVVFPKPSMEKYEFSDKPLSVYTGDFDLLARFKVPAGASVGLGVMTGKLRYQACNNNSCFPPRTAEVRLSYRIR